MTNGIGSEFMKRTQYQYMEDSDQDKGLPQPKLQLGYGNDALQIELPSAENLDIKGMDLRKAIESRKSIRKYSDTCLSIEELSYLLWCTQGIKHVNADETITIRNVPSAGARHAFETYLLINKVEGIEPGLYRYIAFGHKLLQLSLDKKVCGDITSSCLDQEFIGKSAATFIWSADAYRMKWRYGERGYRYLHLDAGHVCQNLYLAAESIGSGACAIAAFDDERLGSILGMDGDNQFVVYLATLGKRL